MWLAPQLIEVMACLTQICKPPVPSRVLAYSRHIVNISYIELKEPYQDLLVPISILSSSHHLPPPLAGIYLNPSHIL